MHTAHVSNLHSAIEEYYLADDSEWSLIDPHVLEHEARAAELMDEDDEDAAWLHELLVQNMMHAARDSN